MHVLVGYKHTINPSQLGLIAQLLVVHLADMDDDKSLATLDCHVTYSTRSLAGPERLFETLTL